MKAKTVVWTALVLIILLSLLGAGGIGLYWFGPLSRQTSDAAVSAPQSQAAPPAIPRIGDLPPIKVGVVVSLFNSTHREPSGKLFGFEKCSRIVRDLRGPDMEIRPIVEAGSESSTEQAASLHLFFPGKIPIDAGDSAALDKLDVIVACEVWCPDPNLLPSIQIAVNGGVSMLNGGGIGSGTDDSNGEVAALSGLAESHWGQGDHPLACEVIADHPILFGFQIGQKLQLRPLGLCGSLSAGSIPLIKLNDTQDLHVSGPRAADQSEFYPVYISSLGKGKLVCYQYAAFGSPSAELRDSNRAKFLRRCVRWLANRPVEYAYRMRSCNPDSSKTD